MLTYTILATRIGMCHQCASITV